MKHLRQKLGDAGERAAADLLLSAGYRIVARNHRCKLGEVDLVAERGEVLVFVEVRTRGSAVFGAPEETVDFRKRLRVVAAARDFLARRRGPARAAHFDVIAVVDDPRGPRLTHFENAFDAQG